jgi:hypothetical protein
MLLLIHALVTTAHTKSFVSSLAIALCPLLTYLPAGDCLTTNLTVDSQLMTATALLLLAFTRAVILGSQSHGDHDHVLLSAGS